MPPRFTYVDHSIHDGTLKPMRFWLTLLAFSLLATLSFAAREPETFIPLAERTPAYFVDRYGPAHSARKVSQHTFFNPHTGSQPVKGEFSVREFRTDGMRVRAVFHVPSLKLAEVRLQMERGQWTDQQLAAALAAYGPAWQLTGRNVGQRQWSAPDGAKAFHSPMLLYIQPPATVAAVEQARQQRDAQRKAVPKF
jgi:hypothetical protein